MSTKKYIMPKTPVVGRVSPQGDVVLNDGFKQFVGGLEDVSGRVSANVAELDGVTTAATMSAKIDELIAAMVAAGQMKAE